MFLFVSLIFPLANHIVFRPPRLHSQLSAGMLELSPYPHDQLHHHNSISESIYFCYSLSYLALCNNCNSSLTCWTTRIHYYVPITNKISSILPSYLTDTHNTQPISPHFLFKILQLPRRIHRSHIPCPYSYFMLFFQ